MRCIFGFGLMLAGICTVAGVSNAKVWSLENTPQKYRPGFCESFRKEIIYDRTTQSYKWAMKRKLEGTMNRQSTARLAYHQNLIVSMRRLKCPNIPWNPFLHLMARSADFLKQVRFSTIAVKCTGQSYAAMKFRCIWKNWGWSWSNHEKANLLIFCHF